MPVEMWDIIADMDQIAQRDSNGRLLAPLPGAAPPITSANARDMVKRRQEKYRRAAVERITKIIAEVDPEVSTGAQAFAVIAAEQAKTLMAAKDPKLSDVERLGRIMTGASEEARRENGVGSPPAGTVVMAPATLIEVVRLLEQDKRAAVDQAQAVDGDSHG